MNGKLTLLHLAQCTPEIMQMILDLVDPEQLREIQLVCRDLRPYTFAVRLNTLQVRSDMSNRYVEAVARTKGAGAALRHLSYSTDHFSERWYWPVNLVQWRRCAVGGDLGLSESGLAELHGSMSEEDAVETYAQYRVQVWAQDKLHEQDNAVELWIYKVIFHYCKNLKHLTFASDVMNCNARNMHEAAFKTPSYLRRARDGRAVLGRVSMYEYHARYASKFWMFTKALAASRPGGLTRLTLSGLFATTINSMNLRLQDRYARPAFINLRHFEIVEEALREKRPKRHDQPDCVELFIIRFLTWTPRLDTLILRLNAEFGESLDSLLTSRVLPNLYRVELSGWTMQEASYQALFSRLTGMRKLYLEDMTIELVEGTPPIPKDDDDDDESEVDAEPVWRKLRPGMLRWFWIWRQIHRLRLRTFEMDGAFWLSTKTEPEFNCEEDPENKEWIERMVLDPRQALEIERALREDGKWGHQLDEET